MLALLMAFTVSACGAPGGASRPSNEAAEQNLSTPEPVQPEETAEPVDPLLALWTESFPTLSPEETLAMSNQMNCGVDCIRDGVLYGSLYIRGSRYAQIGAVRLVEREDGIACGEWTLLDADAGTNYLTCVADNLYYLRQDAPTGAWSVVSVPCSGGERRTIYSGADCDYLSYRGGRLYFTDENGHFVSTDPQGGDWAELIGEAVAYPYLLSDDWVIFQSLADGGRLHLRFLPDDTDITVCELAGVSPILDGSVLYFVTPDEEIEGAGRLCRVDLSDWTADAEPGGNTRICFSVAVSENRISASRGFFFLDEDNLYGVNASVVSKDQWAQLENEADEARTSQVLYADQRYRITEIQVEGMVTEIRISDRETGLSSAIPWLH